nr:hypothetical protein [uncultured Megasphaera sp.]
MRQILLKRITRRKLAFSAYRAEGRPTVRECTTLRLMNANGRAYPSAWTWRGLLVNTATLSA